MTDSHAQFRTALEYAAALTGARIVDISGLALSLDRRLLQPLTDAERYVIYRVRTGAYLHRIHYRVLWRLAQGACA